MPTRFERATTSPLWEIRIIDRLSRDELYILQEDGNLVNELEQCKWTAEDHALDMCLDGAIEKLLNGLSDEEYEEDSEDDGAQGDDAGDSALHLLVEKTTTATPQVGNWLESLEPSAAPLMVVAAVDHTYTGLNTGKAWKNH